jgi:hypothetical protein
MGPRATPEATAVAEAFRYLDIDAEAVGGRVRLVTTGDVVAVHLDEVGPEDLQIVVRDRVTPSEAKRLQQRGAGWLDLTGHLTFRSPAVVVSADVPGVPDHTVQRRTSVFAGSVVAGITVAALAAWPEPLSGVRSTARMLGATPGGVSLAFRRLAGAGYLTSDHRATAALFWAAAAEWRPEWIELPLIAVPPGSDAAAVGALAAAQLGAPIAVTAETPPEYLLASSAALKYATMAAQALGREGQMGRYAIAPSPLAVSLAHPARLSVRMIPVTSEAIVALSLAIDPARGAETVRAWEGDHVWH